MNRYLVFILSVVLFSCTGKSPKVNVPLETKPVEHIEPTQEQTERRAQSEAYCKLYNIPVYTNPNALFLDPESQVTLRTKDEVVDRTLALFYIGLKSEGLDQKLLYQINKDYSISEKFTPREKSFVLSNMPDQQQKVDANWKYECMHVMLWALSYIDTLGYPGSLCDVAKDVKIIHDLKADQFRQKAKLRSKKEILDQADLILRLDWACVNAKVKNEKAPGGLNSEVVYERHYALNWLIRYFNQNWDEVTTDT